jgi:hypothetical protein
MIIRRGTLGSECKHGLKRRVCATCRQQLRDKLFPPTPKARRMAGRALSESGKKRPDIPAGLPGNGKRR